MTSTDPDILHYEVSGKGPAIVLLHGYLAAGPYWDTIRSALQTDYTVIAIDLLGFGKSPKPKTSSYDYDEQLAWIKRTLAYAEITEPFLMAGHSMGSLLALRYSLFYPDSVNRLLLINLPLFTGKRQAHKELSGTNLFYRAALYWRMHRVLVPIIRTKYIKAMIRLVAPAQYKGAEEYAFASSGIARNRSLRNVIENQTAYEDIGKLTVPITIVMGLRERRTYIENVRHIKRRTNIHIVFADTSHHTPLEAPELITKLVRQK